MVVASLRALLERSIDYAGLFPPASLTLEPALQNHAEYLRAPDNWILGTFILPVGQFEAASTGLAQFDKKHPLRVSALAEKTENVSAFRVALETTMATIHDFSAKHIDVLLIDQLEMPLPAEADAARLAEIRSVVGELTAFWEAPADAAERTIALLAEHNSAAKARSFGFKLRTGGVTAADFPSSEQVATALVAAAKLRVPIKFTAGLHHPLRKFDASVETKMHGFINVLGAGVLAAEYGWDEQETAAMLDEENASAFSFDENAFIWREWEIATDRIKARRKLVTSLGSCSFDEPREDLRALELFP